MFRAISSSLSFLFTVLILKVVFPEIAYLVVEITLKALNIINAILDSASYTVQG